MDATCACKGNDLPVILPAKRIQPIIAATIKKEHYAAIVTKLHITCAITIFLGVIPAKANFTVIAHYPVSRKFGFSFKAVKHQRGCVITVGTAAAFYLTEKPKQKNGKKLHVN